MPDMPVSEVLATDPKHLVFTLARYKFVAKMFAGYDQVLEVGCATGVGARIIAQAVTELHATDPDISQTEQVPGVKYFNYDLLHAPLPFYDGVYCLDVFEHIADEATALSHLSQCAPVCIIGTPSLESQVYASASSKEGHVNCKSGEDLRRVCLDYWEHVFLFGMNDETLHTGFLPMCHYLIALCVGPRKERP
jgi:hypothetical protein